jgi:eukaryotic-like serine/threonine-protein kinase
MVGHMHGDSPNAFVGELLAGRYRVVQHVATGGVGYLYVAEDVRACARVKPCFAVKVLRPEHVENDVLRARFVREIEATMRVRSPHVLPMHHHGRLPNDLPYFIAELLVGLDLADTLDLAKCLAPSRAVAIAVQIAHGLAATHSASVVHRDLKPENVFLVHAKDGREHVKLLDFGLAWIDDDPGGAFAGRLTLMRTAIGTPEYMSPEQAAGEVGRPAADIYALGIVLFEMLSGAPPFEGPRAAVAQKHACEEPPPLARGSTELHCVVRKALGKVPSNRYVSALEMAEALRATPEGQGLAHLIG